MYTGGTTGLPKGVLLDQRAEMLNLMHVYADVAVHRRDVFLHQTPMFHAASMGGMLGVPAVGGVSVFLSLFDPAQAMELHEKHEVTATVMVPTMIGMLLNHPEFRPERLRSLRMLTYGASPMPGRAARTAAHDVSGDRHLSGVRHDGVVGGAHRARSRRPSRRRRALALGRSTVARVSCSRSRTSRRQILPVGETGEVCARAGNFMREYWKKPEATAEAFRGGWYHSGDAGYLDADGYLFLVDRVKDMIVTGGENVYSVEVENALASHPAVVQVAVIGIPSEKWGEAVHAIVVLRPGAEVTEAELIEHTREWIAGFKVPKSIEFRTEPLPLSGAMKVLKKDLRAPYWEGHDRAVN